MTRPKLHPTKRPTKKSPLRKHRKEDGRPRGTFKKYRFEQTRLGFMLKYEVPVVYYIIMNQTPQGLYPEPEPEIIEVICRASKDPALGKPKFRRYLEEYRQQGICCKRPKILTPERREYYERIRKRKMKQYIDKNAYLIQLARARPGANAILEKVVQIEKLITPEKKR